MVRNNLSFISIRIQRLRFSDLQFRVPGAPEASSRQLGRLLHLGHGRPLLQGHRRDGGSAGRVQVLATLPLLLDQMYESEPLLFDSRKQSCYFLHHMENDPGLRDSLRLRVEDHLSSDPDCTIHKACAYAVELIVIEEEVSVYSLFCENKLRK